MVKLLSRKRIPLTTKEITAYIMDVEPSVFSGKTPERSLYSAIYRSEKRREEHGCKKLFKKSIRKDGLIGYKVAKSRGK